MATVTLGPPAIGFSVGKARLLARSALSTGLDFSSADNSGLLTLLFGPAPQIVPEQTNYTVGPYLAYCATWSTYPGGENEGLTGHSDTLTVYGPFPREVVITSDWPTTGLSGGVCAYDFVSVGNYDGGVPAIPTRPLQIGKLQDLSWDIDLEIGGATDQITVLNELFLTNSAGNANDKACEVGLFLHSSVQATVWFASLSGSIGTWVDPQGRSWVVKDTGLGSLGIPYIVGVPVGGDVLSGTIDMRSLLVWLVGHGVLDNAHWINGFALGHETHGGFAWTRFKNGWPYRFLGGGVVASPVQPNLITAPDFSTVWSGFGWAGKSVVNGNAQFSNTSGVGSVAPYDGVTYPIAPTAGSYYEVTYTLALQSGGVRAQFGGSGASAIGVEHRGSGTFTERLLAPAGTNTLYLLPTGDAFVGTINKSVSVRGPYSTAIVGGS